MINVLVVVALLLSMPCAAYAGLFSMSTVQQANNEETPTMTNEIKVVDSVDKLIQKRQREARKLIDEGRKLIEKGNKKKKQSLVVKGQIKKEIGEKQLELLQEQSSKKEMEDSDYDW